LTILGSGFESLGSNKWIAVFWGAGVLLERYIFQDMSSFAKKRGFEEVIIA
jgi:hypothetical protein